MSRSVSLVTLAVLGTVAAATPALAAPIVGGVTSVTVAPSFLSALGTLGLTPSTLGSGFITTPNPTDVVLNFPITGGTVGEEVLHAGSGLRLAASSSIWVDLTDFVIDLDNPTGIVLTGGVSTNGINPPFTAPAGIQLFNIDGALTLTLADTAADALETFFGLPSTVQLNGALVGTANVAAQVPEPASLALFLAGLAGVAASRRVTRKAA
jgi:hypothetical protein